ncbi:protachykinin-like [Polyodon spathula]|uniref:protachykinin-like n=1 Tax=Polyodon spathula TaxID=7913 RepID=UPI001B7E95A4|nr:protachykinin-like [Polyodon spathula]
MTEGDPVNDQIKPQSYSHKYLGKLAPGEEMESLKLLILVVVMLFAQVYCAEETSLSREQENWPATNWQKESSENNLARQVAELIKRSKSHQFYGLMGRRSGAPRAVPMGYKRHKGEMFVGLMGRRSSSGELSEELDRPQYYASRRK